MKALNKNRVVLIVLLLGSFALASNLSAQQTESSSSEAEQTSKPSKKKSSDRVFKPSEKISEDSPVPFPVDI